MNLEGSAHEVEGEDGYPLVHPIDPMELTMYASSNLLCSGDSKVSEHKVSNTVQPGAWE